MRFGFWLCKLRKLCKSCELHKICLGLAVVGMIGCTTKSPNTNQNIKNSSVQDVGQNIAKVTINISSQIDGLNKSVLTYWCKVDEKPADDEEKEHKWTKDNENKGDKEDKRDKDDKNDKADMLKQDFTPQSPHSKDFSSQDSSADDFTKNFAQDFSLQDSKNHKSNSELDLQAKPTHTTQNPSKLDTTKPPKCKAIGGANAFFRALKTSRFRAPRDEVVELEAGVYYLAAFEIEAKRHILRSCDKEASKCGGYEGGKPRFLAFRVDSGENLILPKVEAKEANLANDFDSKANDKKSDKKSNKDKESKKAKKSKNDEPKELIFVILEDFDKQESENLPHKAESKRGNAIFSLGSSVSFEFDSSQNNKNEANQNSKNLSQKSADDTKDNSVKEGVKSD